MSKIVAWFSKLPILTIFVLSLPAIRALSVPGFYGASDDLHIAWLSQLDKIIREGQLPPRFVPDLSFQYGYPLFNFVFPLPFYVGEIIHRLGFSFVDSIKLVFALSVPISGYFMFKLVRVYASFILSIAAAVIYMYTPYRSTDIYVRGAVGEIVAFVFLPLIIFSAIGLINSKGRGWGWIGLIGISTAALITSHNIVSYMFLPFLFPLIFVLVFFKPDGSRLKLLYKILSGIILGLIISGFFWLPALLESRLMKPDTVFNFVDHFPTLRQLVTPYFGYGASVPGPYDGMSFFVGTVNLLMIMVGLFGFFWKFVPRSQKIIVAWGVGVLLVSVFMMNYRSSFVWSHIPLLPYFQFPWRFLSMVVLVTPLFVIVLDKFKYSNLIALGIIFGVIILNYKYFRPHDFLGRRDDYYLNRYIPFPTASLDYTNIGEEYLRLPRVTQTRPQSIPQRVTSSTTQVANLKLENSLDASFSVDTIKAAEINYNKYFFPGWQVTIDGRITEIRAALPFGQIQFDVPAGNHKIVVRFKETILRAFLDVLSISSLLFCTYLVFKDALYVKKI